MEPDPRLQPFVQGLAFPESPRWHRGALWFSDFYTHRVSRADARGRVETVAEVPGQPSGLGWLPDGRLLVVSMNDRRLLRLDAAGLRTHAELSPWAPAPCNDMRVDALGRAWVGNFGFDLPGRAPFAPTVLLMAAPDGQVSVAAEGMHFPNGTVFAPDGRTLVIAESYGQRLTAFDVAPDGRLSNRRVWAPRQMPSGPTLPASWTASPRPSRPPPANWGARTGARSTCAPAA